MLASALPVHHKLSKLVLVGNKIADEGISAFVDWMLHSEDPEKPNQHILPEIELAENLVSAKGCEALAKLLSKNPNISRVDLSNNLVDDDGAIAFAELLKSSKSKVKELGLSSNHISSKGASAIAEALKMSTQELTVDMSGNKLITRQGISDVIASKGDLEFVLFKVRVADKSEGETKDTLGVGETPQKPKTGSVSVPVTPIISSHSLQLPDNLSGSSSTPVTPTKS